MTPERAKELLPVITAFANGEAVQRNHSKWTSGEWIDDDDHDFECADYNYRIAPKPVARPWSKPEDVPGPVCWLRKVGESAQCSVVCIDSTGVIIKRARSEALFWCELIGWENSTDRKNWSKCEVTEAA